VKLIVGLGNPGLRYELTRHNLGFLVADEISMRYPVRPLGVRCQSLVSAGKVAGEFVILAKPTTYMNNSGAAVAPLLDFYRLSPASLIIIHDDIDLEAGRIKDKYRGGDGGHLGIASLINALETDRFCRIRVGAGRPPEGLGATEYVLAPLRDEEIPEIEKAISAAADKVEAVLAKQLDW
jgi:PTH1 family peptidyl-tRNA hydrolase